MNIPNNYFLFINVGIIAIYLLFIFIGYKKGFLFELVSLIYTGVSALIAWFLAPVLGGVYPIVKLDNLSDDAKLVSKFVNLEAITNTVIYFVIIFLILKLFYWVIALLLKSLNKIPVIGKFNQILGALAGIVNATIIVLILSTLLNLPVFENGKQIKEETFFGYIHEYSQTGLSYILDNVDLSHIQQQFKDFDIESARNDFKEWLDFNNE